MPTASRFVPDESVFAWMRQANRTLLAEFQQQSLSTDRFAGEWVVNLAPGLDPVQAAAAFGAQYVGSATDLIDNTYFFRFDVTSANALMAHNALEFQAGQGQVEWFYPLLARQVATRFIPNDPQFGNQWHLLNTGQGGGAAGEDANVTSVWDAFRGAGVQIAVIDDGLQWNHPDLAANGWINPNETVNGVDDDGNGFIDDIRGWDFNGDDNNPTPTSSHGTSVGGIIAARGNNAVGVSGMAPEGQLVGLRLIAGAFTDADEAAAFRYQNQIVDIYSNSWGPSDDGSTLEGPGPLALAALQQTYTAGRGGLGGLFTWAGGNGGDFETDNSNYDGYANSRFTLGIAAFGNDGLRSSYSEQGANLFVAAPSDGGSLGITTTAFNNTYTNGFGGTSGATPMVSGVIALMLQANPTLTSRDVQYILAQSSRQIDSGDADWATNSAGYHHNHKYGFGAIDAQAAVNLALGWTNVGAQVNFTTGTINAGDAIPDAGGGVLSKTFNITEDFTLEHVEVIVNATHTWRGDLEFRLISPTGTRSVFAFRGGDSTENFDNWKFMTVRNWGEVPTGTWTLEVEDMQGLDVGTLNSFRVNFFALDPNLAPLSLDDGPYSVAEDQVLNVNAANGVLANDGDPNADPITAQVLATTTNGSLVLNPDGSFTYTPNANYNGPDSFTYRAHDGRAFSAPATVTLNVTPVNDVPVAVNNPGYFVEGGTTLNVSALLGVLTNDSDPEGDSLSAIVGTTTTKGVLFLQLDGSFSYTPNAGATGFDTFTYRAFDGTDFSNFATATIQINSRPVAQPNSYSMAWNQSLTVFTPGVLGNDSDLDGDALTAELVTATANGTLSFLGNGGFTYTPSAYFYGTDSFTYRVRDSYFAGNTVTVSILVEPTPVAGDDSYAGHWGQYLDIPAPGVLMNDVNLLGGPLSVLLVGGPSNGTLVLNPNGSFRYLAANNFVGVDSFTYKARTASGIESNVATVRLTITAPPNRPPVAVNDFFVGFQGTPLMVGAPGVKGNDFDPEGDPFTAILVAGPANGLFGLAADGSFSYTPNAGFVGTDTFTYQLTDGLGFSNVATVTLQINPGTPPPAGADDAYVAQKNQSLTINAPGVLLNDTDPLGRPLTALLGTTTTNGLLFLNANGSFSYTPNANFTGTDQFTYRAVAAGQQSNLATVTITVTNPALPPLAAADSYQTQKDTPLFIPAFGVLGNDSDPQALPLTAQLVAGPATGALQLNANGSFLYTPSLGFTGQVSFTYQASNGLLLSNVATATIHVTPGPGGVGQRVVVAPDAGFEPRVKVFDGSSQTELASFLVFEASFRGGVRVATADLTADGIPDIIVASGPGRASTLKVYDGNTLQPLAGKRGGFSPFSGSFGLFVTTGDVNGDGTHDLIVGQDAGGSPQVKVFDGKTGNPFAGTMGSFLAYASNFRGGVRVAAGDVNGDGKADVITAPGVGTISGGQSGRVKTFDLARRSGSAPFLLQQFNPYGTFTGGVFVASGDLDGDGRPELITAPGAGLVGEVKIYAPNSTVPSRSFTPLGGYTGGLRPSVGDVNGDGRLDLILGTGTGTSAKARFYDAVTLGEMFPGGLEPFGAAFTGGLFAAGLRTGR